MRKEEIGKYLIKLQLCEARDQKLKNLGPFKDITSVREKNEYDKLPEGFSSLELTMMSHDEIEEISDEIGIKSSIYNSSADVFVNDSGLRIINSKLESYPIIKNLTRNKIEYICNDLEIDIDHIDESIEKYWILRENGSIGEEVENKSENSPFKNCREHFSRLIEYFLFDGNEKDEFDLKSDNLLLFSKPLSQSNWRLIPREKAVAQLWNEMKISLKHQGMPSKYPNNEDSENNDSIDKWVRDIDGFYVGALNIRL